MARKKRLRGKGVSQVRSGVRKKKSATDHRKPNKKRASIRKSTGHVSKRRKNSNNRWVSRPAGPGFRDGKTTMKITFEGIKGSKHNKELVFRVKKQ